MKLIEQHVEDRCKLVKVIDTCKSFESILCLKRTPWNKIWFKSNRNKHSNFVDQKSKNTN